MPPIKSLFTRAVKHFPPHQQSKQYTSPISIDDLTGEYLQIEIPESLSSDAESAVTALLTETHRNGFTVALTESEGYPSLFPPGASLFNTNDSTSRLQDLLSVLDRFTHVVRRGESDLIVLNAARIEDSEARNPRMRINNSKPRYVYDGESINGNRENATASALFSPELVPP